MLKLEVINYKGITPSRPISAEFDKVGGSIGRGDINALILPDTDRYISRLHARISYRSGRYFIEDHGTAVPVIVNGRTLGKGIDAPLEHGDEVKIGDYRLRALVQELASPANAVAGAAAVDDPMAMFGGSSASDPFADLAPPKPLPGNSTPQAEPHHPFAAPQTSRGASAIPADFDPFANLGGNPGQPLVPSPGRGASSPAAALGLGAADGQSIDALFGLGQAPDNDPLAETRSLPESNAAIPFDAAPNLDPMARFQPPPVAQPSNSQRNNVPEWHGSFVPPKPVAEAVPPARTADHVSAQPEAQNREPSTVRHAPTQHDAPAVPPVPPAAQEPPEDPLLATQRFTRERVENEAIVRAFLDGAGIADLNLPAGLTPQSMHMLGQVLRETVQGMLDLLLARATLKRELRADVTMIVAKENNPLKFSPNVEVALAHLLSPQRGYMEPLAAVKDACNDLRSHQFAFMAGMRAALEGILHRFNPEQLEQRLKQKTMLDSVLPINRKAKMWDQFADLYGDMSKEAADDFHVLFGREFVRAYEAQIDRLRREDGNTQRP